MNDLQVIGGALPPPPPSAALQRAADRLMNPYPGIREDAPVPAVVAEARAALPALERAAAPADRDAITMWLLPMTKAKIGNPPATRESYLQWAHLVVQVSGDLPASVWCEEAMTDAMRQLEWWPSPAKMDALLRPRAKDLLQQLRAVRAVMAAAPAAEQAEVRPASAEVRDAVIAKFSREIATVLPSFAGRPEPGADRPGLRPLPSGPVMVTPAERLRQLEQLVAGCAKIEPSVAARIAALRAEVAG